MGIRATLQFTIRSLVITTALFSLSITSHAQTLLRLSSNQFTVSVPSTSFSQTATVSNTGTVGAITGVPTTGSLTVPNFSFTIDAPVTPAGTATYSVGIIVDEASSQRQLEVFIPTVTLTFDGSGNLTGSLGAQTVKIYGRDSSGATLAQTTVNSTGSVSFNGNQISFSAADQIALIQAQGGILADITTSINNTGLSYNYTVILARTGGTAFVFEHTDGTDYPSTGANEFVIGTGDNGTLNTAGQKLTGTVTFSSSTSSSSSSSTSTSTDTTTTTSTGGTTAAGGGTTTSTSDQITSAAESITIDPTAGATDAQFSQLVTLTQNAASNADSVATSITSGSTNTADAAELGTTAITAISSVLSVTGAANQVVGSEKPQAPDTLTATLNSATGVLNAVASTGTLDPAANTSLIASVQTAVASLTTNLEKNVARAQSTNAAASIANALSGVLNATTRAGVPLSPEVRESVRKVAATLANSASNEILTKFFPDKASGSTTIAEFTSTELTSSSQLLLDSTTMELSVEESSCATALSAMQKIQVIVGISPCAITSTSTSSLTRVLDTTKSLADILAAAITPGANVVDVPASSRTDITVGQVIYPTEFIGARIVPEFFPKGASYLADGSVMIVAEELAMIAAPQAKDLAAFTTTLTSAYGATATRNTDTGSYLLETADLKASITFAFEDASATGGAGTAGISSATGNPADPAYKFMLNYADGSAQSLIPFVAESNFIDSLNNLGFLATIDRSSGVVTLNNGLKLKPDVIVRPLSVAAQVFLNNKNGDENGVGFAGIGDVNGDGLDDYEIISAVGQQTLYGVTP